ERPIVAHPPAQPAPPVAARSAPQPPRRIWHGFLPRSPLLRRRPRRRARPLRVQPPIDNIQRPLRVDIARDKLCRAVAGQQPLFDVLPETTRRPRFELARDRFCRPILGAIASLGLA